MWTSAQLKANAKLTLQTRYGIAILVSFVAGLLTGGFSGISGAFNSVFTGGFDSSLDSTGQIPDFFAQNGEVAGLIAAGIGVFFVLMMAIGFAFSVFVASPILVGHYRFYLMNRLGQGDFGTLFSAFKPGYLNVVKTVFLKNLYITLWTLLLIVPGVIKSYEYYLVEYILAENPHIESARAIEISRQMTNGQKFEIFFLELSFLGWTILSMITCGIGFLFLTPYMQATYAELYTVLREKAILEGTVSLEELTGVAPMPAAF